MLSSDATRDEVHRTAAAAADIDYPTVACDQGLDVALDIMVSAGVGWIPVVDTNRVVGVVAMNEIITGHQLALRRSLHLLANVTSSTVLVEAPIGETSRFAGTTVATAPWPRGSFALSIDRHSQLIAPRPDTALQVGDTLVVVAPTAAEAELRRRLVGPGAT